LITGLGFFGYALFFLYFYLFSFLLTPTFIIEPLRIEKKQETSALVFCLSN
jgi:hypothetical protein